VSKASLISQLKIEREPPQTRGSSRRRRDGPPIWPWVAGVVAVLLVVGALGWFLVNRPDLAAVETATAKPAWGGGAAQGGSLLDASGYVVARRQATVSSKITGKVAEVLIEEGQHVAAGQVIARLDDSNARAALDQARAQAGAAAASVKVAEVTLADALPKYQRSQRLHDKGFLSEQDVEDSKATADTARENLALSQRQLQAANAAVEVIQRGWDDTVIRAPFAGVVTVKAAQPGEMVSPVSAGGGFTRTGIGTIVDMDSLEVDVDVAESFINRVTAGMPASVKLNAYPDWEIPAEVIAVVPTADQSKATVSVRVGMKLKDARIIPQMGAHVAFLSPSPSAQAAAQTGRSVIVPADAVQTEDNGQAVVFVIAAGHAERRAVRLGDKTSQGQTLLGGVSPGEVVAVEGADKLKDGMAVKVKPKPGGA
jgi:RND family efflux transporter MFP subunit